MKLWISLAIFQVVQTAAGEGRAETTHIIDYTGKPYTMRYLSILMGATPSQIGTNYAPGSRADIAVQLDTHWVYRSLTDKRHYRKHRHQPLANSAPGWDGLHSRDQSPDRQLGSLLMAGATSLPELLSAINAISIDAPNLAGGSMFGSGMFKMFMLGLLDLLYTCHRVLRRIAATHSLTASLGTGFIGTTLIAITTSLPELVATVATARLGAFDLAVGNLAQVERRFFFVKFDALLILIGYFWGVYLLNLMRIGV